MVQWVYGGGQPQARMCIQDKSEPDLAHISLGWVFLPKKPGFNKVTAVIHISHGRVGPPSRSVSFTCELLHRLQPDADGLVGEQRGGGQRARHALHYANVLHALGHGERGHGVVSFKGTVAVYTATCRMGGEKQRCVRRTLFSADDVQLMKITFESLVY